MVAIEGQHLRAIRNNRNHWKIDPEDLKLWMDGRDKTPSPSGEAYSETTSDTDFTNTELLVQIKGLEVELKATQERLSEVKEDRDHWREQAQDLVGRRRWWHF